MPVNKQPHHVPDSKLRTAFFVIGYVINNITFNVIDPINIINNLTCNIVDPTHFIY